MLLFVLFVPLFVACKCHVPQNSSDVFVTYTKNTGDEYNPVVGHKNVGNVTKAKELEKNRESGPTTTTQANDVHFATEADVMFIPNNDHTSYNSEKVVISDILEETHDDTLRGVMRSIDRDQNEDDSKMSGTRFNSKTKPDISDDTVFVTGKNREDKEDPSNPHSRDDTSKHQDAPSNIKTRRKLNPSQLQPKRPVNCEHLICDHVTKSVCGKKTHYGKDKYRLFKNSCFFEKVNCAFHHDSDLYKEVDLSHCNGIGSHQPIRLQEHHPIPPPSLRKRQNIQRPDIKVQRRSFSGRRSLTTDQRGHKCSHPCPATCPDNHDPVCGKQKSGVAKVFLNHCKLDQNSCVHDLAWYIRPLSECVGKDKADIRQNRAFVGWMQRLGVLDGEGRLARE